MNRKPLPEAQARRRIVAVCRRLYDKDLIAANDGNVSYRLNDRFLLITPSGVAKGRLVPGQIVKIRLDGTPVNRRLTPSSEYRMHLAVYRNRGDVRSVVHAHPPFATGFAAARIPLDKNLLPEVITTIGEVPLIPYRKPGSVEMADTVGQAIRTKDALLLSNHGVIAVGPELWDAYDRLERTELFARINFIARSLGGSVELSEEQIRSLLAAEPRVMAREKK